MPPGPTKVLIPPSIAVYPRGMTNHTLSSYPLLWCQEQRHHLLSRSIPLVAPRHRGSTPSFFSLSPLLSPQSPHGRSAPAGIRPKTVPDISVTVPSKWIKYKRRRASIPPPLLFTRNFRRRNLPILPLLWLDASSPVYTDPIMKGW